MSLFWKLPHLRFGRGQLSRSKRGDPPVNSESFISSVTFLTNDKHHDDYHPPTKERRAHLLLSVKICSILLVYTLQQPHLNLVIYL
ncbi:hypothetical protein WAI453_010553 [Rhynchosporium graminicola]